MPITLMKEEALSSFAIRSLQISGSTQIAEISKPLFTRGSGEWLLFPLANAELVKIYARAFSSKSVISVIQDHTLAPIYRSVSLHLEQYLHAHFTSDRFAPTYNNARVGLFNGAEVLTAPTRFCPLCFAEQASEFGFTWFKREWQIHLMGTCLAHGCSLLSRCICGHRPVKIEDILSLMQGRCEECTSDPWKPKINDTEFKFPQWLTNLLYQDWKTFSGDLRSHLKNLCLHELRRKYPYERISYDSLARLYDPYYVPYPPEIRPKRKFRVATYADQMSLPYKRFPPYTAVFHPLSHIFPDFQDFKKKVEEISCLRNYLRNPDLPMLDLNDDLHPLRKYRR